MELTAIAQWLNTAFAGYDYAILQALHNLAEAAGGFFTPLCRASRYQMPSTRLMETMSWRTSCRFSCAMAGPPFQSEIVLVNSIVRIRTLVKGILRTPKCPLEGFWQERTSLRHVGEGRSSFV